VAIENKLVIQNSEEPIPKSQIPKKFQIPNYQIPNTPRRGCASLRFCPFDYWNFFGIWDFVIWNFYLPWQFLNFLPLPQGQGSLRPT
jgi:hypothetical protein